MPDAELKILLVDDDHDQYLIVNDLLFDTADFAFALDWTPEYAAALDDMVRGDHDIYLVDYHLGIGQPDGLELLREALARGATAPIIMLTAEGSRSVDLAVMQAGAADYLVKGEITGQMLERALRYAGAHARAQAELRRSHEDLERRVAERTAELRESNERLQRELSERRRLEAQLLQAQKMESIGRLAGGVAHDFNNLLTAIIGSGEMALGNLASDHPAYEDIEQILKAAERASTLTRQLLAFARKQVIEPRVLSLNELIVDMHKLLRRLIGEDIELATLPASDLAPIRADPGQIQQVIVNLAVNARDAMPSGGTLTIETRNVDLEAGDVRDHISMPPGQYVLLAISDTGSGMDAAVLQHLFEPFFTTKPPGKGTGLGLATCYGIVKQHGGYIWPYSEVGRGTTIKIYLPQAAGAVESQDALALPAAQPGGSETILLVEDEPAVRALAARVLRGRGYTVIEAGNGREALRAAEQYDGAIHLLLTDMVMPQMNGDVLAEHVAALRPGVKVLFISGYADHAVLRHGRLAPGATFLQKPFSPVVFASKVREALDRTEL